MSNFDVENNNEKKIKKPFLLISLSVVLLLLLVGYFVYPYFFEKKDNISLVSEMDIPPYVEDTLIKTDSLDKEKVDKKAANSIADGNIKPEKKAVKAADNKKKVVVVAQKELKGKLSKENRDKLLKPAVNTLTFAKPVKLLTTSVIDINKFKEYIKAKNEIPVVGVLFAFNKAKISATSNALLKELADNFKKIKLKPNAYILIEGFTCDIGTKKNNIKVARWRANSLKKALVRFGVPEKLIKMQSMGESKFVASKDIKKDRKLNRRANVSIIIN